MITYILTKFGAQWLIFVDTSVLTRKCRRTDGHWTDGHRRTVSDHNSSGELNKRTMMVLYRSPEY